jgi:hypothetical protein
MAKVPRAGILLAVSLLILFTSLIPLAAVSAQVGGRITGVIKDQSGAIVPGAKVVVRNGTGFQQETTTNDQGSYTFPVLAVGHYEIAIDVEGFKHYQRKDLVIDVGAAIQVDVALEVAVHGETVTVSAEGEARVETSESQVGETINSDHIATLPLISRSYTDLLALQPGITPSNTSTTPSSSSGGGFGAISPSGNLNAGQFSVSGQRESANGFMLNGASVQEGIASGAAIIPNLDSISEFRVLTSNFDAEYGNYSGGLVSVITKSGADQFHGSVFDFVRDTALDARGFFDPTRAAYDQNQFGGTFGGPIKNDKVFFFADYEGNRSDQGLETGLLPVPSLQDRAGNLSDQASSLTGSVGGSFLASLLSQRLGYTVTAGERYYTPGCSSTGQCVFPNAVIPQRAWSAPAQQLLQYIALPNSGSSTFTSAAQSETINDDKGALRVDASTHFGELSAYYLMDQYGLDNPYPVGQGGANVPGFDALSNGRAQLLALGTTKTFGQTAVNEFRVSLLRDANNLGQQKGGVGVSLASQGFTVGGSGIVPGSVATEGVESIEFNKITFGTNPFSLQQINNAYQVLDNFSKVMGSHALKFGGQFHSETVKDLPDFTANGQFQFFGSATGLDFADFLLGLPSVYNQGFSPAFYQTSRYAGAYIQDSWRVTPSLTLNYGLRWDVMTPWSEEHNQNPTLIQGDQSVVFPGAPKGLVFPGDPGIPSTIAATPYHNFSPRLGLAYSPPWTTGLLGKLGGGPGKSSIRAGFGRYYTAIEGLTVTYATGNAPYGSTYASPVPPLFQTPFIGAATGQRYPQQFPVAVPAYGASPQNPNTSVNWSALEPINGIDAFYPKNSTPYSENYFLSVQRQLGSNTVLTLSYIGSQAHHLLVLLEANPGIPATCLSVSQPSEVMAGTQTCGPFGENGVYTKRDGTVINGTRQPFGSEFGSAVYFDTMGNSAYNSLQAILSHTSHGLTILGSYTYGKSLDQASNLGDQVDPFNYKLTRAISSFDLRQDFVVSYRYELPFDRLFTKNRLTQGWALSGITRLSTGLPVTLFNLNDTSLIGGENNGVNGVGIDLPNFTPGPLQINHNPANGQAYFNTSLFTLPALGALGTSSRRFFYGPGEDNWDMALLKAIRLKESKSVELRLETFNTFNHPQFFGSTTVDGNISSPTFGHVTSSSSPRLMQAAVKFIF